MNLERIRALVSFRSHGSLAKTASALGISQTTLRGRLAALADEVGVPLIKRTGRRLVLTPAGAELARGGRTLIREVGQAIDRTASGTQELLGSFHVAIPVGLPPSLLVMVLRYGHLRHPKLRSHIHPVARPLSLLPDQADVAVTFEPRPTTGPWLSARLLKTQEGLFASPDYLERKGMPERPEDLHRHHLFSWIPPERPADEWPLSDGGSLAVRLSHGSADIGLIRQCALEGLGIARFPKGQLPLSDAPPGSLVPVLAEVVGTTLSLTAVMPDTPRMRRPFRAFFGNIREGVGALYDG